MEKLVLPRNKWLLVTLISILLISFGAQVNADIESSNNTITTRESIPHNPLYQIGLGTITQANSLTDEEYLIATGSIGTFVYDPETLELVRSSLTEEVVEFHDGIYSFKWSPNEETLAFGDNHGRIYLWDTSNCRPIRILADTKGYGHILAWSLDGRFILSQPRVSAILWNVETGERTLEITSHRVGIMDAEFSADGLLATVGGLDRSLYLWDVETQEPVYSLRNLEDFIWSVAFSPDGANIATGGSTGTVTIRDTETGEAIKVLTGLPRETYRIFWTPDGNSIVASSWNLGLPSDFHESPNISDAVIIWDVTSNTLTHYFDGQYGVAFNPENMLIASLDAKGTILFQEVLSGDVILSLDPPANTFELGWSFNGDFLATRTLANVITIWA
jgi:WD40 repeat protein